MDEAIIEDAVMTLIIDTAIKYFGDADADCRRAAAMLMARRGATHCAIAARLGVAASTARRLIIGGRVRGAAPPSIAFTRDLLIIETDIEACLLAAIAGAFTRAEAA